MLVDPKNDNDAFTGTHAHTRYAVRQILYLIPRDGRASITPVQVIEEIRRTTLEGTVVTHAVRVAGDPESFVLDDTHEVFTTPDALKVELLRRAAAAIDVMVCAAAAQASAGFIDAVHTDTIPSDATMAGTVGTVPVRMPDGTIVMARVSGPVT